MTVAQQRQPDRGRGLGCRGRRSGQERWLGGRHDYNDTKRTTGPFVVPSMD
jgi:hypothetical protein